MDSSEITVEILKDIRDEMRASREDIRGVSTRIDQLRTDLDERLDHTNERLSTLERRQVSTETRLATELIGVKDAVDRVADLFRKDRGVRAQVADHEKRIEKLEKRAR